MRFKPWFMMWGIVSLSFFLVQCGQQGPGSFGSASGDEGSDPPESDTVALRATTQALSDGLSGALSPSLGGLSALHADEKEAALPTCTYDEETRETRCDCPQGGTMTLIYEDEVNFDEEIVEMNHTMRTVFADCHISACGQVSVINGEIIGSMEGTAQTEPPYDHRMVVSQYTAEECAGLNVDGVDLGFNMTWTFDGSDPVASGWLCHGATGERVDFETIEELMQYMDPYGRCEYAEAGGYQEGRGYYCSESSSHSSSSHSYSRSESRHLVETTADERGVRHRQEHSSRSDAGSSSHSHSTSSRECGTR